MATLPPRECPWCGVRRTPIHVHGHAQCSNCGINIEPCCDGAAAGGEIAEQALAPLRADPGLFRRLFTRLGGETVTVTENALSFALVEQLSTDVQTARDIIAVGVQIGQLQSAGAGLFRCADQPPNESNV